MNLGEAVEKADQGGYTTPQQFFYKRFLDPIFWQALGKTMGGNWDDTVCKHCGVCWRDKKNRCKAYSAAGGVTKGYIFQWHRMVDHIAEGGTIESFFKTL